MQKTENYTGNYEGCLHFLADIARKYTIEKYDIPTPDKNNWIWNLEVVFDDEKSYTGAWGVDNYDILLEEEKIPLYLMKEKSWKNKAQGKPYLEPKTIIMGSYMDVWKEEYTRLKNFYDLEENQ